MSDHELLRSHARDQSQAAFATLVQRHLDLVYSAALRQVRSSHRAEEIAQSVFIELARRAPEIRPTQPLAAWLYVVTRRTALNAIREESRRLARETAAAEIAAMKTPSHSWSHIADSLDDAMETLNDTERAAVVLRFFQNLSLREVGASLGVSEDTAQKRVSRALDRLRAALVRRGIAVTAAGLATDLSAHALQIAPASLGASVTAAVGGIASQAALPTTVTLLAMTALEKTLITGALIAALGGIVFEANTLRAQRLELATLRQRIDHVSTEARQTRQHRDATLRRIEDAEQRLAARASAARPPADLAAEKEMNAWLDRVARLRQLHVQRPDLSIPELQLLPDEEWFHIARTLQIENEEQIRSTLATLRTNAERLFIDQLHRALRSYLDARGGKLPENSRQLAPFFEPLIDPATLDRYEMIAQGNIADLRGTMVIRQKSPIDFERDTTWEIGLNGHSSQAALRFHAQKAVEAFMRAHAGARPSRAEDLQRYLPAPVDPAKLQLYLGTHP